MQSRKTIEETIDDLSNPDPRIVLIALDRLSSVGDPVSLPVAQIVRLLSDPNWKIRGRAARYLGHIGSQADAAVTGLTGALRDPIARVRVNAAAALGSVGAKSSPDVLSSAVLALTGALQDSSPGVRVAVGIALKSLGHPAEGDPAIQEWQSRTIEKKLPKPETVEKYVAALKEGDPKKRITAMRKLSDVVRAGQADLNALVIPSVPELIALLSDPSWKVRTWAVRLLGRIGPDASAAVPHLVLALQDRTIPVRECAAYALGRLGEKANAAIPVLEQTLHDPTRSVRTHAHMALRNLQHKDNTFDPKINADDELVGYPVDDDLLDIHYWVLGHVRRRPWHYRTNLVLRSKQYTVEQLHRMIQKDPRDYEAKVMLAERMENWGEKIEYLRRSPRPAPGGVEEENEWQKAWFRLYDECPSFSFTKIDSVYEYPIPNKFKTSLTPNNPDGVSEKICNICDFIDPAGTSKQSFWGGIREQNAIGAYDQIIKLTYMHFLCRQGSLYTLYVSHDEVFLVPVVWVTLEEAPTLGKILEKITAADPRVSKELSTYLRKDLERDVYISLYRLYVTSFDDFINHFAYGRVMMDDHFQITPLDLI